jgi:CubicO group peptidase (beta-lactamase class C family)
VTLDRSDSPDYERRRLLRVVQTATFLCLAVVINPGAAPADDLRAFIETRMKEQHLPGLSMAVIKNGKIVDARGFGLANLETATTTSPESVYWRPDARSGAQALS